MKKKKIQERKWNYNINVIVIILSITNMNIILRNNGKAAIAYHCYVFQLILCTEKGKCSHTQERRREENVCFFLIQMNATDALAGKGKIRHHNSDLA